MTVKKITALAAAVGAFAMSSSAMAAFSVTFEAPTVVNSTATFSSVGIENFDGRSVGAGQSFATDFGGSAINGNYSNVDIANPNVYGGAGGAGKFATTYTTTGYTLTLDTAVNYFGYWLSALDGGNQVKFFNGATEVYSFAPTDVLGLVAGNPAYFGNPFGGGNSAEPYVFLNFFDVDGTFDRIEFSENTAGGGYESDNHTVGFYLDQSGTPVGAVPEPGTWMLMLMGFGLVGTMVRRPRWKTVTA